ncbi:hypothetical protein F5972_07985 [Microbispora cellulosiformans]|uniref:Uncharacterized protein n=1 Tax=Microbispora cellulosiformans TaxID=2614688 RepID=A0A5J5K5L7_9ACTN|nr:hypothetical protein [Microbispora cellulosiformans]KAA9379587.1 hypothetical protein F5972_07985 [Microbispora cellulosiformans]
MSEGGSRPGTGARPHRMHRCPMKGCTARLPLWVLFCKPHWRVIPLENRRAIRAAYKQRHVRPFAYRNEVEKVRYLPGGVPA